MQRSSSDIAFSPSVKAEQEKRGSRTGYARLEAKGGWADRVTEDLAGFIAARDSFYLATASADGQPYIQHRGGPNGFLRLIDEHTLGFADFAGNRQYITLGNLAENPRAQIFLMDYENRQRVKIWGRARMVEDDPALVERLTMPGYKAVPERAILLTVEAWDANCNQHIEQRFDTATVALVTGKLRGRIAELEAELEGLRAPD